MRGRTRGLAFFYSVCAAILWSRLVFATDADYEPPASYYTNATGTGATLKSQLHTIISTGVTSRNYDSARSSLQLTDADPNAPGHMLSVYTRESINVAAINSGSIPGWDGGTTWNREHTWPQSRGVNGTGVPDGSDLFELRPSSTSINSDRGNLNYGGAFHANNSANPDVVTDGGQTYYYPGDADAGMVAREAFYMAVRYDGSEANTANLEVVSGNPAASQAAATMGNLDRMLEWHYIVVPDSFERRRNQFIYSNTMNPNYYQGNRDPFVDHPEWVWSVFKNQTNNSQISLAGATVNADGSSTRTVDLGHVFVDGALPSAQNVTLNKNGTDGTYYNVATAGLATSSVTGRFNAFKTNTVLDTRVLSVGLNATAATAGIKTGTVTIDNLDITTGGGSGHGAGDQNDVINLSYAVLDHAKPSFNSGNVVSTLTHDFGSIVAGSVVPSFQFDVANLVTTLGATAGLDFDSLMSSGDTGPLSTDLAGSAGALTILAGATHVFNAMIDTATPGMFSATYTLSFSESYLGQSVVGELTKTLMLTLAGEVTPSIPSLLAGDYNRDGVVDAADYSVWRDSLGTSGVAFAGADGDGDMTVDQDDFQVWVDHFGMSGPGSGSVGGGAVPEPTALFLLICGCGPLLARKRR